MRVFVTGGSGFIGGHVVERLVKAGHQVVALARSPQAQQLVERYGATASPGDLSALGPEQLRGCEAVVHAAAHARSWGTRAEFWEANVEGTRRALEAARTAGVARFVHLGTEAAFFVGEDLVGLDERAPYPQRQRYLYAETKAEAERLVLAANGPGFTTLSLRPRLVWGPRDGTVLPEVTQALARGAFTWVDGGRQRTSTTYVGNLAHAVEPSPVAAGARPTSWPTTGSRCCATSSPSWWPPRGCGCPTPRCRGVGARGRGGRRGWLARARVAAQATAGGLLGRHGVALGDRAHRQGPRRAGLGPRDHCRRGPGRARPRGRRPSPRVMTLGVYIAGTHG